MHVPDGVELETAAAAMLQGMTAHYLTNSTWQLKAGETALVHAAAGGMGLLLSQIGKARGARVIGTTSTEAKAALAREAGADVVINYTEVEDLAAEVRALTDGRGVDVVYDGVGKTTFDASLASLRKRGLLALYGAASGPVPPFDPQLLNRMGSLFLTRPTLMDHIVTREELEWRAGETLAAVADGSLKINIGAALPAGPGRRSAHRAGRPCHDRQGAADSVTVDGGAPRGPARLSVTYRPWPRSSPRPPRSSRPRGRTPGHDEVGVELVLLTTSASARAAATSISAADLVALRVQQAAEHAGEREHVVDLVRVVATAGRDDRGMLERGGQVDLRIRVGQREHDRFGAMWRCRRRQDARRGTPMNTSAPASASCRVPV